MDSIRGGNGDANSPSICELWLTELTKGINVRGYSAVAVFVKYRTTFLGNATSGMVVVGPMPQKERRSVLAEPMGPFGIGSLGLLIPSNDVDPGDSLSLKDYENLRVGIRLTRSDSQDKIFIQSVVVLGIPR